MINTQTSYKLKKYKFKKQNKQQMIGNSEADFMEVERPGMKADDRKGLGKGSKEDQDVQYIGTNFL